MSEDDDDGEQESLEQPTFNAADPQSVRRRQTKAEIEADNADNFWRHTLSTEVGRTEIWKIIEDCGTFRDRFGCGPNGSPQPEASWFHAGEKAVGQRLFRNLFIADREGVTKMLDEHDPAFMSADTRRKKRRK